MEHTGGAKARGCWDGGHLLRVHRLLGIHHNPIDRLAWLSTAVGKPLLLGPNAVVICSIGFLGVLWTKLQLSSLDLISILMLPAFDKIIRVGLPLVFLLVWLLWLGLGLGLGLGLRVGVRVTVGFGLG